MKKMFKTLSVIALALTMLFTAIPASAASSISYPSTQYFYLTTKSTSGYTWYDYISVSGLASSQKVTASSVKSSKTSVAARYSLSHYYDSYSAKYYSSSSSDYSYSGKTASIGVKIKKAGTATISYKIGSTTYKTKLYVKAYTNPVKKITLTNVNSGKTFASKTADSASSALTLSKTASSATLKVYAASGWKVQSVDLSYHAADSSSSTYNYFSRTYSTPKSSASLNVGKLTKGRTYYAYVTFVNSSNGGTLTISYTIS